MAVYVVTGKLGAGKTLVAVGKIQDKLVSGCKVATNLDLKLHKLPRVGVNARSPRVIRIPDKPSIDDLQAIGLGNTGYDESKNGLLVLDECGTWFNSRSWADKERQHVINWFLHARKLGWDIIFLIQDISIMDKQARLALAEHVVYCRRLDKITIPFIGGVYSLITGSKLPMPKLHIGIVKYGDSSNAMTVERWNYTGRDLYSAYDTKQAFSDAYDRGAFTYLPPCLTHGIYSARRDARFYMKLTRIYFRKTSKILLFLLGVSLSSFYFYIASPEQTQVVAIQDAVSEPDIDLSRYTITSSALLGTLASYELTDTKGNRITSSQLIKEGFFLTYIDSCTVNIKKGRINETVKC